MTMLSDAKAVRAWARQTGIENVVVISPHLDDAVFSIAGFISAVRNRTEVITLFTEGQPNHSSDWTRMTGFSDSEAEHAARRQEDALAMSRLKCRSQHLGLREGEAIESVTPRVAETIERIRQAGLAHTLVLLPAGAGGPPPRSWLRRLAFRIMRRPIGTMPHGEHLSTRNLFWQALAGTEARIGFYAELPYAWSQRDLHLQHNLRLTLGCETELVALRPDVEEKRQLAELYRSQVVPVLGRRLAYRRRVLARNECIFVAKASPENSLIRPQQP